MEENIKQGIKHLIECNCILPQFQNIRPPVFHKIVVFSIIENDKVCIKHIRCPNCGAIHEVFDLCRSKILIGKEKLQTLTIEDIKINLPKELSEILELYDCDLHIWEEIQFIYDEKRWGIGVYIKKETENDLVSGKILKILAKNSFKVENFSKIIGF